ncbi:hypothetical protein Tco_1407383 [Tanacetum coccineum]
MFGSCGASATSRAKALPCAQFLLFPELGFPLIASTEFGRFPPAVVAWFILGQFFLKWLGSPHSKQVGLGLSLVALPMQYRKEEFDIWAMEMDALPWYIVNDVWKEHMRRFHRMDDAKEIWEAIRTRSLPPAWSNLAMTMRTKPDVDTLSIDDLYNNLRVFEQEIQSASKTSSSAQNVAFVSQSKSSTNKVKSGVTGAYSTCTPFTSSTNIPEKEVPAGFADEVIYSLFAKESEDMDLLHEDLEQIDDLDIEEMDINWQIAMIAIQMKKFYKKIGRRVRVGRKNTYCRLTKTSDFKGVPHPLSGDYTPTPQEEIDESFAGSIGTSSEHYVDLEYEISRVPSEVYVSSPITTTEKGVSAPKSKEVKLVVSHT